MNLQMLKKAMLAYVSAVKFIWSGIAYPLSIMGKKLMNLRGYRVYGNSVQDGTPTPDSPVEIQSVGDLSTKNLFDIDNALVFNGYIDSLKKIALYNPTPSYFATLCINCKPNTTYTVSRKLLSARFTAASSSNSPAANIEMSTSKSNSTGLSITITTGESDEYLYVWFYNKNIDKNYTYQEIMEGIQIEEGTTATEYEPYHKYKIPVVVRGKNLFDGSSSEGNGKYLNSNGVLGSGSDNLRVTDYITIPSGVSSLTFSYKGDVMNYPSICLYDDSKNYITGKSYGGIRNTNISVPSNAKYVRCSYRTVNTDIQLEGGSTKTEYEPYRAPVTTNIFLEEPLRKVGDYADYVDFEKQKVVRNVKEATFSGAEDWRYNDTNNIIYLVIYKLPSSLYCYSTHFLSEALRDTISPYFRPVADILRLYQRSNNIVYSSADEFKTFLQEQSAAGTPLIVDYILSTPTEETVKLPALPQFKGTTIYEVGTNIKPSGMEAKYC